MKKKDGKALEEILLMAINKVLLHNKVELRNKPGKSVKKAIRQIVKKLHKSKKTVPAKAAKESNPTLEKIKLDGQGVIA